MFRLASLRGTFPPYQKVEGPLKGKEADTDGTFYLRVGPAKVEVDSVAYETLNIGDRLRVLYTRDNKAISIDRLKPPSNGLE